MIRAYAFDLDGTLYRGESPIESAVPVVAELRRRGATILFLTNNSGQSGEAFAAKLRRLGYEARADEVYGTARGAAVYLQSEGLRRVFVVGEKGLARALAEEGLTPTNLDPDGLPEPSDVPSDVVLCGICRHFSYALMASAMSQITQGARFVATNRDSTYPMEGGRVVPGAGSVVIGIATCSGVEPFTIGKPNPYLLELAMRERGLKPDEVMVVGDRMDTDIDCGIRAGCRTHLVLTGVEKSAPAGQPWSDDLTALL